jgi:hypothetical protein
MNRFHKYGVLMLYTYIAQLPFPAAPVWLRRVRHRAFRVSGAEAGCSAGGGAAPVLLRATCLPLSGWFPPFRVPIETYTRRNYKLILRTFHNFEIFFSYVPFLQTQAGLPGFHFSSAARVLTVFCRYFLLPKCGRYICKGCRETCFRQPFGLRFDCVWCQAVPFIMPMSLPVVLNVAL